MFESMQEGSKGHARLSSMMEREDSQSTAALFVLIRAADAFFAKHSRYPGNPWFFFTESICAIALIFSEEKKVFCM